jgi:non-specific serine/threonine protein kinase
MEDRVDVAWPLMGLGWITWYEGDDQQAHAQFAESLELFRAADDRRGITWALNSLGLMAWAKGNLAQATVLHEEALALAREIGDRHEVALVLVNLGYAAEDRDDLPQARARYSAAVTILQEAERPWILALCLEGLAGLLAAGGDAARAVRALGAATVMREVLDLPLPPVYGARRDRLLAATRAQLGSATFEAAWEIGRAMPLDEVLAGALSEQLESGAGDHYGSRTVAASRLGLTARERDVLRLLAEGRSDKEIAAALFIGRPTVSKHVSAILGKLGVGSRAAAAATAVRDRLV